MSEDIIKVCCHPATAVGSRHRPSLCIVDARLGCAVGKVDASLSPELVVSEGGVAAKWVNNIRSLPRGGICCPCYAAVGLHRRRQPSHSVVGIAPDEGLGLGANGACCRLRQAVAIAIVGPFRLVVSRVNLTNDISVCIVFETRNAALGVGL